MQQGYNHKAFDLNIQSNNLLFHELKTSLPAFNFPANVSIQYGDVDPQGLDAPLKKGLFFQAKKNAFWLNVPGVARFLVENGCSITIFPLTGVDEDSIRLFILGSCFGALLIQRGLFLLHGNAIKIGTSAVSFTGISGAGKSTMSGVLIKRGYSILADDVCAVNAHGEVIPSFPQIKLWADVAKQLMMDTASLRKIRPNIEKYAVPLADHFHPDPLPLKLVYILDSHNVDDICFKQYHGIEKYRPLYLQTYRLNYINGLAKTREHNIQCGQLANRIALARVTRPNFGLKLDQLADYIEADMMERGLQHG